MVGISPAVISSPSTAFILHPFSPPTVPRPRPLIHVLYSTPSGRSLVTGRRLAERVTAGSSSRLVPDQGGRVELCILRHLSAEKGRKVCFCVIWADRLDAHVEAGPAGGQFILCAVCQGVLASK
jgi:hypothetical protein